jgi:CBS-domain-containing membrane protein
MPTAKDIMKKDVVTVDPDTTVEEAGRLFMEKDISGAPVVGAEGRLYGLVTENDLITRDKRLHIPTILRIFDAFIPLESPSALEKEIRKITAYLVKDICTREVITIKEDTPLEDIATIMTEKKVHLLPVVKDKKLLGIVGRHEVLNAIRGEGL